MELCRVALLPRKNSLKELSRNHLTRVFVSMAYLRNFLLIFSLSLLMSGLVRDEDKLWKFGGRDSLLETSPSGTFAVLSGNQKVIFLSLAINFSTTCFRNPFVEAAHIRRRRKFCLEEDIYGTGCKMCQTKPHAYVRDENPCAQHQTRADKELLCIISLFFRRSSR